MTTGNYNAVGGDPSIANVYNWTYDLEDRRSDVPVTAEIGTSGIPIYAGRQYDEWDPRLQGDLAIRVYREMQTHPVVAAFLFGIDQLVRKVHWDVEPADGEDPESDQVNLVDTCLHDMSFSWAETLSQHFSMIPYGWSYSELVYKRRLGYLPKGTDRATGRPLPSSKHNDGLFGWRKIALRTQETRWRWEIDEEGGVQGMWQSAPPDYIPRYIPIERALLFRTSVIRPSPEGQSVLRGAFDPFYKSKRVSRIEMIGIDRDLVGIPMAWVPPEILRSDATPDQVSLREALKDLATGVRRDEKEGFLFPLEYDDKGNKRYDFELMTSGGSRQFDTDAVISRYNQQIAMPVLADFIMLGNEEVGAYNLGESKTELFTTALQAWLDVVAGVYNTHAIPRLMAINGFDPELSPKLKPGKVAEAGLAQIGTLLQQLTQSGAELFPNEELRRELMRRAGLPDDPPDVGDPDATDLFARPAVVPRLAPSVQPGEVAPSSDGPTVQPENNDRLTGDQPAGGAKK